MIRVRCLLLAGLLALCCGPSLARLMDSNDLCRINIKNYGAALQSYYAEHQQSFPDSLHELVPRYLATSPQVCPLTKLPYIYELTEGPEGYAVMCLGRAHSGRDLRYTLYGFDEGFEGPELRGQAKRQAGNAVDSQKRHTFLRRHGTKLYVGAVVGGGLLVFLLLWGLLKGKAKNAQLDG